MRGRLALLVLLAACKPTIGDADPGKGPGSDDGGVEPEVCAGLEIGADGLAFTDTAIGFEAGGTVVVSNPCPEADLEGVVSLSAGTPAPFALRTNDVLSLAPGESVEVEVTFTAPDYAAHEGSLEVRDLTSDGTPTTPVPLYGRAAGDQDGDGSAAIAAGGGDCDDTDPQVLDQAEEQRQDLVDDDCDGLVDEDFLAAGDVVVTEFMARPVSAPGTTGEWFEVTNTTLQDIDLYGWTLADDAGEALTITGHVVVPGEGRVVLGASTTPAENGSTPVDYAYDRGAFTLADVEDAIYLYAGDLLVADAAWSADWTLWDGRSMELDREFIDLPHARQRAYWCPGNQAYGDGDMGTPGARNKLCPSVDHDGDGYSLATGDCDDPDGAVSPGEAELWDGIDNDCDGSVDALTTDHAAGWVSGGANQALTWATAASSGDLDGDGVDDLIVGTTGYSYGTSGPERVWLVSGADLAGAADPAEDLAYAAIETAGSYGYYDLLAHMGPRQGDVDGDGQADLLLVGSDQYSSYYPDLLGAALFWGGALSGGYENADADASFTGIQGSYQTTRALSHVDLDGDGTAEVVITDPYNYAYSGTTYTSYYEGRVAVFRGADLATGDALDVEDADWFIEGATSGDNLGASVDGVDLDGDGRAELLLGAPGDDQGGTDAGAVWVLSGAATLDASGTVDTLASQVFTAPGRNDRLGYRVAARSGDFDADGRVDLVLTTPADEETFVFLDAGALGPAVEVSSADVEIDGQSPEFSGNGLAVADLDADGVDDLLVGAPDTNQAYAYQIDDPGEVWVFSGASLVAGAVLGASDADATLASSALDGFGYLLIPGDYDGDGTDEVVVGAPFADGNRGRAYLFDLD